jgi:hypothetical protein
MALAACGGPGHQTTADWRLERVEPDGRTLHITWTHGVGDQIERIDAKEAADSVTITVYVKVFQGKSHPASDAEHRIGASARITGHQETAPRPGQLRSLAPR